MQCPNLNKEGYLQDPGSWSPEVAQWLAANESIVLTEAHWEVIQLMRLFYANYQIVPSNRAFVQWVRQRCGPDKGCSIYLLRLFPGNVSQAVAKLAGLPKTTSCL